MHYVANEMKGSQSNSLRYCGRRIGFLHSAQTRSMDEGRPEVTKQLKNAKFLALIVVGTSIAIAM
jgi:hypothetical protein